MTTHDRDIVITRKLGVLILCVPVAYLVYLSTVVLRYGSTLCRLYEVIGSSVHGPQARTAAFVMATYKFWWLVPLALGAAVVHFALRPQPSKTHAGLLLLAGCLHAAVMQAFLVEGVFASLLMSTELHGAG